MQEIIVFFRTYWAAIVAVATMVGVFLGPRLAAKYKEKQERKNRHSKKIKTEVLQPLKDGLTNYYLPTLHEKWVHIISDTKRKRSRFISKEDYKKASKELEFELKIDDPHQSVLDRGIPPEKTSSFIPDDKLYSCTKEKHFPQFIRTYEEFKQQFDGYNKSCLNAVEKIREEIKSQISLPSYRGVSGGTAPYIYENLLAVFVLKKRIEEDNNDFLEIEERKDIAILKTIHRNVAQGNLKQIKECREKIENLAQEKDSAEDLVKQAEVLIPEGGVLRNEVEKLLRQERLPGTCKYL